MNSHDLTRILIEGAVGRTLNQVRKDSHRSLRNLVDLGLTFSKGRFQQTFLELAQHMLENENSAYYTLLDMMVERADHESLKTFGVNAGYEGLTRGARTIRRIEAEEGCNVPWALGLELEDLDAARDLIRQGMELGIYIYGFEGRQVDLVALRELMDSAPQCAFGLFTTGENLLRQGLGPLEGCRNVYISVKADDSGLEAAEALGAGGFLYGIHVLYEDDSCIAPEKLERYLDYKPLAVALLPRNEETVRRDLGLYEQVKALRFQQKYPYFLLDLVGDCLYVDQVISEDPCMLYIRRDGSTLAVDSCGVRETGDLTKESLIQVLRQALPKGAFKEGRA